MGAEGKDRKPPKIINDCKKLLVVLTTEWLPGLQSS